MRHDPTTTPFDVEAEELTQQFWGASKGWISSEQPTVHTDRAEARGPRRPLRGDDTTGSMRAIRDGFAAFRPQTSPNATGEIRRVRHHGTREHGRLDSSLAEHTLAGRRGDELVADRRREATLGELAAGRSDVGGWLDGGVDDPIPVRPAQRQATTERSRRGHDDLDEPDYDVPLSPVQPLVDRLGLGAVDPLLVRAGMAALALILLVPLMLSLRPDRADDTLPGEIVESPAPATGATPAIADTAVLDAAAAATTVALPPSSVVAPAATEAVATAEPAAADRAVVESEPATSATTPTADAADVDVVAERVVPACPQTYTAAAGDSWYRIADGAGVTPDELLAENNATLESVILPGDDICLPAGASMPAPPTTAPAVTAPPATATPTTAAPATTVPATTVPATTVAPVANLSRSEVQELIRQTWPADEVDTALAIAKRESNFIATADNGWCCVGVFQLYWTVHRGWLDDFGITQRSDLYDARKNIAAAYHMWQTQGWGPWGG